MKLGPVTKFDMRNTETSKKLTTTSFRQVMMSSSFFKLMVGLEQSGAQILDTWSIIPTISLIKKQTELKHL